MIKRTREEKQDWWNQIVLSLRRLTVRGTAVGAVASGKLKADIGEGPARSVLNTLGSDGVKLYPKAGAAVLVQAMDGDMSTAYLLAAGELEKAEVTVGGFTVVVSPEKISLGAGFDLVVKDGEIQLGGQALGGLVKVQGLLTEINALQAAHNTVVLQHNALIAALAAIPLLTAFATALTPALVVTSVVPTQIAALENPKVKQ